MTHGCFRILVVDDDPHARQRVAACCSPSDERLVEDTASAADARRRLQAQKYDLLVIACPHPERDVWQLASEIRTTDSPNSAMPIVAMTRPGDPCAEISYREAGFTLLIEKSLPEDLLRAVVNQALAGVLLP